MTPRIKEKEEFITEQMCEAKRKLSKGLSTLIITLLALFVTLVGYSAHQASAANNSYSQILKNVEELGSTTSSRIQKNSSEIESCKRSSDLSRKTLIEKIEEIKEDLKEQRQEQKILLEKILALQISIAKNEKN